MKTPRALAAVVAVSATLLASCGAASDDNPATPQDSSGAESTVASNNNGDLTITDVAGRTVTLDKRPDRVILGEGRALMAVATLNKDNPADKIVAIGDDVKKGAPSFWQKISEAKPDVAKIPSMGSVLSGDVTVENLLSYKPDLTVLPLDAKTSEKTTGFTEKMDQAGLKYVYVDFRDNPEKNTTPSMSILGQVFDREAKAKEFNSFYEDKKNKIETAVKGQAQIPSIIWRAAGLKDCCATVGDYNLGQFITLGGGSNVAVATLNGKEEGSITPEQLVKDNPDIVIATGGEWDKEPDKKYQVPNAELGYTTSAEVANRTREGLAASPGIDQLSAVKDGHLYSLWHQFYTSPWNIFAAEQIAQWQHPEAMKNVDPAEDFKKFHEQWLPYEYSGTFFSG